MEKIRDFVPTRGGGRSFAIGTFGEKNSKPVAKCSPLLFNCSQVAHLNGGGGHRLLLLDVFDQADLGLLNNCREINFIKIKISQANRKLYSSVNIQNIQLLT